MRRTVVLAALLFFVVSVSLFVRSSAQTESNDLRRRREDVVRQSGERAINRQARQRTYRSPGANHKLLVPDSEEGVAQQILSTGKKRRSQKYGSYTLVEVDDSELATLDAANSSIDVRDDLNVVMLRNGAIDTTGPEPSIESHLRAPSSRRRALNLVQLFGPPTPESIELLKSTGARLVSYLPNNTYLVWTSPEELSRIRALKSGSQLVQWDGPFHPAYKLERSIKLDSPEQLRVSIALVDSSESPASLAQLRTSARQVFMEEKTGDGIIRLKALMDSNSLGEVARRRDVLLVEPWPEYRLNDERAGQIVAGALTQEGNVLRPTGPGYLQFLNSVGFTSNFDFTLDFGDTGIDKGSTDPAQTHPDFLDAGGASRVSYLHDFTNDPDTEKPCRDLDGHGTLNASVAAGFNNQSGDAAFADPQGFRYGLGVAPFLRIGVSKLFDRQGRFRASSFSQYISQAYSGGARISTNSWGACETINGFCNLYADDSSVFDRLVRDADPFSGGNQGLTIVFSAGNDGGEGIGTVGIPATAKNVITVGAAESVRLGGPDGAPVNDGCGVGGAEADNALDIVGFSALGPCQDGRAKPDMVAPGTHVEGAASQDPLYTGDGICGTSRSVYFPLGQTLYTWSSGTSHAAPAVAGAAGLAFQWLRSRLGTEPSPALVKAFLLNSTRYMSGRFGGDTLPGAHQGWGLLDINRAFANTDRVILDQDDARTFTTSGGSPFQVTGVVTDSSSEFRVMLVWTDAAGNPATNAPYVNQLNLEVVVNGVVYSGNNFNGQYSVAGNRTDIVNNIQGIRLERVVGGSSFIVRVKPTLIAGDGVPGNGNDLDQDFALIITNGREAAVPVLTFESVEGLTRGVTIQHATASDTSILPGERSRVTISLLNQSASATATFSSASLVLKLPDGTTVRSGASSNWPDIPAGGSASNETPFEIQVPASLRCGSIAEMSLELMTPEGLVQLPVRVRVGRPIPSQTQVSLLNDDVDAAAVKWKLKKFSIAEGVANSGTKSYQAVDPGSTDSNVQLSQLLEKKQVNIPANAGNVRMSFFHIFNFEPGYDGGVLEVSTDGGETWQDLGSRAIVGGYDGKVTAASQNPLGNRFAWTARGRAGAFSRVVIDLDSFAGRSIRLRFLAGFDQATGVRDGFTGWFIDDIRITTDQFACSTEEAPLGTNAGETPPARGVTGGWTREIFDSMSGSARRTAGRIPKTRAASQN